MASQPLPRCLQPRLIGPHIHPDVGWRRPPWVSIFISSRSPRPGAPFPPGPQPEQAKIRAPALNAEFGPAAPVDLGAGATQQALGGIQTQETDCLHATVIHDPGDACLSEPLFSSILTRTPKPISPSVDAHVGDTEAGSGRTRGHYTPHMFS